MPITKDSDGLTIRQRAYAREYVRNGGKGEQAAIAAGYGKAGARQRSTECLQAPAVQEEIRRQVNAMMSDHVPMCLRVLAELAEKAESETVRNSAAQTIMDRTGYKLPDKLVINDTRTAQDVERDLAVLLGIAPSTTGEAGESIEALAEDTAQGNTQH